MIYNSVLQRTKKGKLERVPSSVYQQFYNKACQGKKKEAVTSPFVLTMRHKV